MANIASRGLAGLAALAQKAVRSPIQQATMQQQAQRQQTVSRDPAAPRFAPPAAAPGFSDQQYASPERRYSEQELAQSVNQLFSQSRNASRAAAQDQVYVEGSRAQNQRTLQSDAIYGQQELQRAGLENQRRLAEMSINASMQMQRSQLQYAPTRTITNTMVSQNPGLRFGGGAVGGSGGGGGSFDPGAAAKAAMDAQLASRERMQGAQIAAGDRQQAAQLQFQREAPGLQANAEDELRRRAAMRALEVFRQGQGGGQQALSLSNQGRVA